MYLMYPIGYYRYMGILEEEGRRRTKRNELRKIILEAIRVAGVINEALLARSVMSTMIQVDLLLSPRQQDVIARSRDRLIKSRLLERNEKGLLRLSQKGQSALAVLIMQNDMASKPRRWDKKWRILIFDIPEYRAGLRQQIRHILAKIGFVRLQDSVWIYPYDCEDLVSLLKADLKIGKDLLYMVVEVLENEHHLKQKFNLT